MIPEYIIENVIGQKFGRMSERKRRLKNLGYDYNEVQHAVNKKLDFMYNNSMDTLYILYCKGDINLIGAAHLTSIRSGLSVELWSHHGGVEQTIPIIQIMSIDLCVYVSISENPKILMYTREMSDLEQKDIDDAVDYIRRNYDLFLKHYTDTDFNFDDEDLFNALRERGEYR